MSAATSQGTAKVPPHHCRAGSAQDRRSRSSSSTGRSTPAVADESFPETRRPQGPRKSTARSPVACQVPGKQQPGWRRDLPPPRYLRAVPNSLARHAESLTLPRHRSRTLRWRPHRRLPELVRRPVESPACRAIPAPAAPTLFITRTAECKESCAQQTCSRGAIVERAPLSLQTLTKPSPSAVARSCGLRGLKTMAYTGLRFLVTLRVASGHPRLRLRS